MGELMTRAWLLYGQDRAEEALRVVQSVLAEDPESSEAHGLAALCLAELKRLREATRAAEASVALDPDSALAHFYLAHVLSERDQPKQALASVRRAIELDPSRADFRALEAGQHLVVGAVRGALEAADRGLELEPENVHCMNVRAAALVRLGRHAEAAAGVESALGEDPDNSLSHANRGWTHLHAGEHGEALESFGEALRLDPDNDWAREGLVEALKARNVVYRAILSWYLLTGRLSRGKRIALVLGLYLGFRVSTRALRAEGSLTWLAILLGVVYLAFVYLSAVGDALFNLLLLLDRRGRNALSRDERRSGLLLATCYALALVLFGLGALTAPLEDALVLLIATLFVAIPVAGIHFSARGWPRWIAAAIAATAALCVVAAGALVCLGTEAVARVGVGLAVVSIVISFLSTWAGIVLHQARPSK